MTRSRKNSAGFDLSEPENLNALQQNFKEFKDSKITAISHATATTKTAARKGTASLRIPLLTNQQTESGNLRTPV